MSQLDLSLKDNLLVQLLAVSTGPVPPGGDGPLVEPETGDDGLHRTAVAEQRDHERHQVERFLEAVERGVAGRGEGLAAGEATITLFLAAMHADVTQPLLAACGALGVVAGLGVTRHPLSSTSLLGQGSWQ